MDRDNGTDRFPAGVMGMNEDLYAGLGLNPCLPLRKPVEIEPAACEITEDRQQMRIADEWLELVQTTIIGLFVVPTCCG